jgi:hypothetical protein
MCFVLLLFPLSIISQVHYIETYYSRLVTIVTTRFNFQESYILPTKYIYVFFTSIFPSQYYFTNAPYSFSS